jgi:hypothetical protein
MTQQSFANTDDNQNQGGQGTSFNPDTPNDQGDNGGVNTANLSPEEVAAIVKRDTNAQAHIQTLETETAALRGNVETLTEQLERVLSQVEQDGNNGGNVDMDELANRVASSVREGLSAEEQERQRTSNWNSVVKAVSSKYGSGVDEEVRKIAAENDMSFDDMIELAHAKPALVKRLMGVADQRAPRNTPDNQGLNTLAMEHQGTHQEPAPAHKVTDLRSDRDLVDNYTKRLEQHLAKMNQN